MAVISANLATTQAWTSVEREEPVALRRIVGESAAVQSLRALIAAVAGNHSTIMLTGESGTGKELIARTIHTISDRADRPFVAVQCASFSHGPLGPDAQAGSGTTPQSGSDGFFDIVAAAAGGTIYFDEVADMSLSLQAKLLRHFEAGDARDSDPSDREGSVRIIAASKHGVPRIGPGALQPKLYYRLCVAELQIPPLRDRIDDLPLLADFFNAKHAQSYGQSALVISSDVIDAMRGYAWPGNVQELSNLIERWYALGKQPSFITPALPPCDADRRESDDPETNRTHPQSQHVPTWEEAERELILRALEATDGSKAQAARMLEIERHRLYRKIKKYKIPGTT